MTWPVAEGIDTPRLVLEPLRVEHAAEMAPLLGDPALHTYIGGAPPTPQELRARYARQVVGHSADGRQGWLNWIARERASGAAVGTVQATMHAGGTDIAWVIGTAYQRRGYATEAATAMAGWLRAHGTELLTAHVHPAHKASMRVAERVGLTATGELVDGELRWTG